MLGAVLKRPIGRCQATFFRFSCEEASSRTSGGLDEGIFHTPVKRFIDNNLRIVILALDPATSDLCLKSFEPGPLLLGKSPCPDLDLLDRIIK